jgi:hypothetical protein
MDDDERWYKDAKAKGMLADIACPHCDCFIEDFVRRPGHIAPCQWCGKLIKLDDQMHFVKATH